MESKTNERTTLIIIGAFVVLSAGMVFATILFREQIQIAFLNYTLERRDSEYSWAYTPQDNEIVRPAYSHGDIPNTLHNYRPVSELEGVAASTSVEPCSCPLCCGSTSGIF